MFGRFLDDALKRQPELLDLAVQIKDAGMAPELRVLLISTRTTAIDSLRDNRSNSTPIRNRATRSLDRLPSNCAGTQAWCRSRIRGNACSPRAIRTTCPRRQLIGHLLMPGYSGKAERTRLSSMRSKSRLSGWISRSPAHKNYRPLSG